MLLAGVALAILLPLIHGVSHSQMAPDEQNPLTRGLIIQLKADTGLQQTSQPSSKLLADISHLVGVSVSIDTSKLKLHGTYQRLELASSIRYLTLKKLAIDVEQHPDIASATAGFEAKLMPMPVLPQPLTPKTAAVGAMLKPLAYTTSPNDPYFATQQGYMVGAASASNWAANNVVAAWAYSTGAGITIGQQDALFGAKKEYDIHEDLTGQTRIAAGILPDYNGSHAVTVASVMVAKTNNGIGIAGYAPDAKILAISGGDIAYARWLAGLSQSNWGGTPSYNATPVRVINTSLIWLPFGVAGDGSCTKVYQDFFEEMAYYGVVMVTAAGNDGANGLNGGDCANHVTVVAVESNGNKASYSSYGASATLAAAGTSFVASTFDTATNAYKYAIAGGTSYSAPKVSAVVALMQSVNPNLTVTQIRNILQTTAIPFPSTSDCNTDARLAGGKCGAGVLNAAEAVRVASITTGLLSKSPQAFMSVNNWSGVEGNSIFLDGDRSRIQPTRRTGATYLWEVLPAESGANVLAPNGQPSSNTTLPVLLNATSANATYIAPSFTSLGSYACHTIRLTVTDNASEKSSTKQKICYQPASANHSPVAVVKANKRIYAVGGDTMILDYSQSNLGSSASSSSVQLYGLKERTNYRGGSWNLTPATGGVSSCTGLICSITTPVTAGYYQVSAKLTNGWGFSTNIETLVRVGSADDLPTAIISAPKKLPPSDTFDTTPLLSIPGAACGTAGLTHTYRQISGTPFTPSYNYSTDPPHMFFKVPSTKSTIVLELTTSCKVDGAYLYDTALHTVQINTPPVASSSKQTLAAAAVNQLQTIQLPASDGDNDTLTYTLLNAPANAVLNAAAGTVSFTPTAHAVYTLQYQVSDGTDTSAVAAVALTVGDPVAAAAAAAEASSGDRGGGAIDPALLAFLGLLLYLSVMKIKNSNAKVLLKL